MSRDYSPEEKIAYRLWDSIWWYAKQKKVNPKGPDRTIKLAWDLLKAGSDVHFYGHDEFKQYCKRVSPLRARSYSRIWKRAAKLAKQDPDMIGKHPGNQLEMWI